MKPYYSYYSEIRNDDCVFIIPDIPFWFVADKSVKLIMDAIYEDMDLETMKKELIASYNYSADEVTNTYNEILSLLQSVGIFEKHESESEFLENPEARFPNPVINVTRKCNLKCRHCYADAGGSKWNDKKDMSTSEIKKLIDKILENYYLTDLDKRILISGGEPFLREDIYELINYITSVGGTPLVNSNALLIPENKMDFLKEHNVELLVSLDGMNRETHEFLRGKGTFDKTIDKIRTLKKHNVIVKLSITIHTGNFDQIEEFMNFAEEVDAAGVAINILNVFDRADKFGLKRVTMKQLNNKLYEISKTSPKKFHLIASTDFANYGAILLSNLKFMSCGVGSASLVIDYDGSVYPCYNNMRDDCYLGNALTDDLKEIWISNPILDKLRKLDVNKFCNKCEKCPIKYYCGGGCRGEAHYQYHTYNCACPNCDDIREGLIDLMFLISQDNTHIFDYRIDYFKSIDIRSFKH